MRIIILGYPDEAGTGTPLNKRFTEQDLEKAKNFHRFPQGVKYLRAFRTVEYDRAGFIDAGISDGLESAEKQRLESEKTAAAQAVEAQKAEQPLIEARAKVHATAKARNELMGKLHSAKASLNAHEATPATLRGNLHDATVAELKKLIFGAPKEKIEGLEAEVKAAIAEYDKAAAEYNTLVNPKTKTEAAPKTQFEP